MERIFQELPGLSGAEGRNDRNEDREVQYLRLCNYINAIAPSITEFIQNQNDVPNTFLIFSLASSLQVSLLTLRSISNLMFVHATSVQNPALNNQITVNNAKNNIEEIFTSLNRLVERIKQISYDMPIIRPMPQPRCN